MIKDQIWTNKVLETYAESCSQGTFTMQHWVDDLQISGKKPTTTVKTINREAVAKIAAIEGLQAPNGLGKLTQKQRYKSLPKTHARRELTV